MDHNVWEKERGHGDQTKQNYGVHVSHQLVTTTYGQNE